MTIRFIKYFVLVLFVMLLDNLAMQAQGYGDGSAGDIELNGVVNQATYLLQDAHRCDDTIYVKNSNAFNAGDLLLIMQMQGALIKGENDSSYGELIDMNHAGHYELAQVKSTGLRFIEIEYALVQAYAADAHTQVIRLAQYRNINVMGDITCSPWNGHTGGVLVLNAQNDINLEADINVMSKGYRGGKHHTAPHFFDIRYDYVAESPDPAYFGRKGEGIAGFGIDSMTSARGAPANGAGGANIHTSGGGGGANFGKGGDAGWGYPVDNSGGEKTIFGMGGHALDYYSMYDLVFMGGGGGAGHEHFGNGSSGAKGGGIVMIFASSLHANGHTINASGGSAGSSGAFGDGAGGAGAAGSVMLHLDTLINSLTVELNGGRGGNTIGDGFGPGGGGGGGYLLINSNLPDLINFNGGEHGLAGGHYYGGSNGIDGGFIQDTFSIPFNQKFHRVYAGFTIDPAHLLSNNEAVPLALLLNFINDSQGGSDAYWLFGDGDYSIIDNPAHEYPALGDYTVSLYESNMMCADSISWKLKSNIELPNIFTPNNDGFNEVFPGIPLNNLLLIEIRSRWGEILFSGNQANYNWDGTYKGEKMPSGVYQYTLILNDESGKDYVINGNVTLAR